MSDVTISYKGASIATMDASGTKTLQTAGKYCEGDIDVSYTKPSAGFASGEFTLAKTQYSVTINHGLNTSRVFIVLQRVNSDHSSVVEDSARYRCIAYFGATVDLLSFDLLQGYQYNGGNTIYFQENVNEGYPTGVRAYFGSETGTTLSYGNTNNAGAIGVIAVDSNNVTVTAGYGMAAGRWVWHAVGY